MLHLNFNELINLVEFFYGLLWLSFSLGLTFVIVTFVLGLLNLKPNVTYVVVEEEDEEEEEYEEEEDYSSLSYNELRKLAKESGIHLRTPKKAQLIEALKQRTIN